MESKEDCSDYISDLAVSNDKKILLATWYFGFLIISAFNLSILLNKLILSSGEGTLNAFSIKKKKLQLQSELMDSELLCVKYVKVRNKK